MSDDDRFGLRMVIQQLSASPNIAYRLAVYGDRHQPRHTDFSNGQLLIDSLRAAIPGFDLSRLTLNPMEEGQGSIVFADEIRLSETQLSLLRLNTD